MFTFLLLTTLRLLGAAPELDRVEPFPAEIDYSLPLGGEAYVYLNPQEAATTRVDSPDAYHWYGLCENTDTVLLYPVDWTAYYRSAPEAGLIPRLEPTDDQIRLLIGSRVPLRTGAISGRFYDGYESAFGHAPALNRPLLNELGLALLGTDDNTELWLGNQYGIQLLSAGDLGVASHAVFAGDLDGDGRRDYVLSYGERAATEVLYLSSAAAPGKLVAPVATCNYHYWE